MKLKLPGSDKASLKRDCGVLRVCNPKTMKSNQLMESSAHQLQDGSIVSRCDEGGVVRMKIMVKKKELKQMLEKMGRGRDSANQASSSSSLEQRLLTMRKGHFGRVDHERRNRIPWRPTLQCIPEEALY